MWTTRLSLTYVTLPYPFVLFKVSLRDVAHNMSVEKCAQNVSVYGFTERSTISKLCADSLRSHFSPTDSLDLPMRALKTIKIGVKSLDPY